MCDNTNPSTQSIADYLAQLLKDRKQLAAFPNVFMHMERLLDEEIAKVRASLFQINGVKKEPLILPEPEGMVTTLTEKVYVPVKEHPDFNFVGRILGPRGMTAKQLEQETGCKIMVRGKGSMRDKKKEDANRGKPNWEHLADDLHVLLTVEDTENRAKIKLARAVDEVKRLLVPQADGEDELKKRQLMELAIINGTYRDSSSKVSVPVNAQPGLLNGAGAGAAAGLLSPGEPAHQLIYASPYDYANYAALTAAANPLLATEYAAADHAASRYLLAGF
ncbi:protein held out wings isoform X12 [Bombyx mori]|uniref:protein held out wings isoform X12 n=1 Tax=Bombyx mori TaxID=7091 RepID=UPI002ED690AF